MLQRIDINSISKMSSQEKKSLVESLLRSTGRQGVENIIKFLSESDFYSAPASIKYHSNFREGLVTHSLVVYALMLEYRDSWIMKNPNFAQNLSDDKIIISSLLHDICKCGLYQETEKPVKDDRGDWKTKKTYVYNDIFPIGHGEKSVIMIQAIGMQLYSEEMLAIRYHMGFWGESSSEEKVNIHNAIKISPLITLLETCDYMASNVFEVVNP